MTACSWALSLGNLLARLHLDPTHLPLGAWGPGDLGAWEWGPHRGILLSYSLLLLLKVR